MFLISLKLRGRILLRAIACPFFFYLLKYDHMYNILFNQNELEKLLREICAETRCSAFL